MKLTNSISKGLASARSSRLGIGLRTGAAVCGQVALAPVALTGGAVAVLGLGVAAVGHLTYRSGESLAGAAVRANARLQQVVETGKEESAVARAARAQKKADRAMAKAESDLAKAQDKMKRASGRVVETEPVYSVGDPVPAGA